MLDSHCHLDFPEFDANRPELLAEARSAGIDGFVVPGVHPGLWAAQEALAQEAGVFLAVGLHPWWLPKVDSLESTLAELETRARRLGAVFVGECGLDAKRSTLDLAGQTRWLEAELELARALDLPVILHQVGARRELLDVLVRVGTPRPGGVVHGFSGDSAWARALVARGFHLGFGAMALSPKRERLRTAWLSVPLDRVLIETDAPSAVAPARGSVPADLVPIARELARLRGMSEQALSAHSDANLARLLGLGGPEELLLVRQSSALL